MEQIKKPLLSPIEERILRVLIRGRRPLSIRKISRFAGIAFNTAKNNLKQLLVKGKVTTITKDNKILWRLI